jgi:hypothetical protein
MEGANPPVYVLKVRPNFSPIDVNLQFILREGWSHADRLRFHTEMEGTILAKDNHPVAAVLQNLKPHLLIRRYDKEGDSFLVATIALDGEIQFLSNDRDFAQRYLHGLFLECPPSFHTAEDMDVTEEWVDDPQTHALFMGLLHGALGWGIRHSRFPQASKYPLKKQRKLFPLLTTDPALSCVVAPLRLSSNLPSPACLTFSLSMTKEKRSP